MTRRVTLAYLGILWLALGAARARAQGFIEWRLSENGVDVTKEHLDVTVRLLKQPPPPNEADRVYVQCSPGQLCSVPEGAYLADISSQDFVVEKRPDVTVNKEENPRRSVVSLPITLAATIRIPDGQLPLGGRLTAVDEKTGVLHSRIVDGPVAHVMVPGRPVILCGFEPSSSNAIGCRRVLAKPGETITLDGFPTPARGRGQLLLGLIYPDQQAPWDVTVTLRLESRDITPDVVIQRFSHVYAMWFDAPAGAGTLRVASKFWTTAGEVKTVVPERRTALQMKIPLIGKPSLKVMLSSPETLNRGPVQLDLFLCEKTAGFDLPPPLHLCLAVESLQGAPDQAFEFKTLEPKVYAVRWKGGPFEGARWVDLRDGASRTESLSTEVIEVRGRVTRKGKAIPAILRWEAVNIGVVLRTKAESDGAYRLETMQRGPYTVAIKPPDGGPLYENVSVTGPMEHDFAVPSNRISVRVTAEDGAPVPNAGVGWEVESASGGPQPTSADTTLTNEDGKATLPALPNGVLTMTVRAKGYRSVTPSPKEITDATAEGEIAVALPKSAGVRVQVLDASGAPAAGARVWSGDGPVATADISGIATLDIPLLAGAPLLAYDARGSRGFSRASGEDGETLQIPPSGGPILVRFLTPDGAPLAHRAVVIGMDGIEDSLELVDQVLRAGGDFHSGADGRQRVAGLPSDGLLTLYPYGRPDLAIARRLPVTDEVVFTLPVEPARQK
jgi:hypothetical protein